MTLKERAAMQQALDALEELFHSNSTKVAVEKYNIAYNALREALAEQANNWPENEEHKRQLIEGQRKWLAEQAEYTQAHTSDKPLHHYALVLRDLDKTVDGWCEEPEFYLNGERLYAAPVRTKDLTDDEIMKINVDTASIVPTCDRQFHFARAVIAADREKNK